MLVPVLRSSAALTKPSTSFLGFTPASAYALVAASNISSLYERSGVIGLNPVEPAPIMATRSRSVPEPAAGFHERYLSDSNLSNSKWSIHINRSVGERQTMEILCAPQTASLDHQCRLLPIWQT